MAYTLHERLYDSSSGLYFKVVSVDPLMVQPVQKSVIAPVDYSINVITIKYTGVYIESKYYNFTSKEGNLKIPLVILEDKLNKFVSFVYVATITGDIGLITKVKHKYAVIPAHIVLSSSIPLSRHLGELQEFYGNGEVFGKDACVNFSPDPRLLLEDSAIRGYDTLSFYSALSIFVIPKIALAHSLYKLVLSDLLVTAPVSLHWVTHSGVGLNSKHNTSLDSDLGFIRHIKFVHLKVGFEVTTTVLQNEVTRDLFALSFDKHLKSDSEANFLMFKQVLGGNLSGKYPNLIASLVNTSTINKIGYISLYTFNSVNKNPVFANLRNTFASNRFTEVPQYLDIDVASSYIKCSLRLLSNIYFLSESRQENLIKDSRSLFITMCNAISIYYGNYVKSSYTSVYAKAFTVNPSITTLLLSYTPRHIRHSLLYAPSYTFNSAVLLSIIKKDGFTVRVRNHSSGNLSIAPTGNSYYVKPLVSALYGSNFMQGSPKTMGLVGLIDEHTEVIVSTTKTADIICVTSGLPYSVPHVSHSTLMEQTDKRNNPVINYSVICYTPQDPTNKDIAFHMFHLDFISYSEYIIVFLDKQKRYYNKVSEEPFESGYITVGGSFYTVVEASFTSPEESYNRAILPSSLSVSSGNVIGYVEIYTKDIKYVVYSLYTTTDTLKSSKFMSKKLDDTFIFYDLTEVATVLNRTSYIFTSQVYNNNFEALNYVNISQC